MNLKLASVLVDRKLLKEDCEIDARYLANGLSSATHTVLGTFYIKSVDKQEETINFQVANVKDGTIRIVEARDIVAIDGMDPVRYAAVYNIKADGGKAVQGKRRGRRPKVMREEEF